MRGRIDIRDESGTTMVELLVALLIGSIVLFALTATIVVSMRASARVTSRVDATQQGRLALNRIVSELQSACVAPRIVPLGPASTGNSISFAHARGSEPVPTPVRSVITLSEGKLLKTDYARIGGTLSAPIFSGTASGPTQVLATGVSPIPPNTTLFSYYSFTQGKISKTRLATPLEENAPTAIQVRVGLSVAPSRGNLDGAPINLRDSVLLRLTVPSYGEETSPPCE